MAGGSLIHKDFPVGTFLDINNVWPEVIIGFLNKFGIEANLQHIIYGLLCDRKVLAKWTVTWKSKQGKPARWRSFPFALNPNGERPTKIT